jgi:hypothetical protein
MTQGMQRGARITQSQWDEAVSSAPWWNRTMAKYFDRDPDDGSYIFKGPREGIVLTPDQMQDMIQLAEGRVKTEREHWQRAKGGAPSGFNDMPDDPGAPKKPTKPGAQAKPGGMTPPPAKPPKTADEYLRMRQTDAAPANP